MPRRAVAALLALALAVALPRPARAVDWAVSIGAIEAIAVPEGKHLAAYPYLGLSLAIPLPRVTLIPALSIEAAPEVAQWGLVGSFTFDFPISKYLGIDLAVTVIHNQSGLDWSTAELLVGPGAGISLFAGPWTISPFLNFFRDLTFPGWVLVPGINAAYTL